MKTVDYINELNQRFGWSDYRVAKELGMHRNTISQYRHHGREADDKICLKIAEALEISPEKVLADIHAARAKDPEVKAIWKRIAGAAAMLMLSMTLTMQPDDVSANTGTAHNETSYILCAL